jgi:hypothetical protein
MPITLNCPCGKTLRVADEHARRRVKCPACSAVIDPPAPEPQFEVVDEPAPQPLAAAKTKPAARPRDEDEDEGGAYKMETAAAPPPPPKKKPTFRKRGDAEDDDEDDERPRRSSRAAGAAAGAEAGRRMSFIIGGVFGLALGIGLAVWGNRGTGRGATKLLVFGICIAIGGLVSLVQGLTGNMPEEE